MVSKDTILAMEADMLRVTIEQRTAWVSADVAQSSNEPLSPSKAAKANKPAASKKAKAVDKAAGIDEDRRSTAHPALTDDLPFTPAASFLLPLSTLLAPPHSVTFTSAARTDFVLPAGLSAVGCSLLTNGTNRYIHRCCLLCFHCHCPSHR